MYVSVHVYVSVSVCMRGCTNQSIEVLEVGVDVLQGKVSLVEEGIEGVHQMQELREGFERWL